MPEGHTIRRTAGLLAETFAGAPVRVDSPQGRFADGARLLDGTVLETTDAWGKHLFAWFAAERVLHVHLGLYGTWAFGEGEPPGAVGAVRARLAGPRGWAELRGPITCEVVSADDLGLVTARLGADPLRPDADPDLAWKRLSRSKSPIALLLVDQSIVAGVGNVYRAEVLFRQGISPLRPGTALTGDEWSAIWSDLVALLNKGVRDGRIVTTPDGDPAHYVYRRAGDPCLVCARPVATQVLAGRNLFWCPRCQAR
jgi:formamidopyrimidine-DNA glycosylase